MPRRPAIYVNQILAWADAYKERHGRWPLNTDGVVKGGPGLTWCAVDQALLKGHRGLRGGQSLAKLLLAHRGKRHPNLLPDITVAQILVWADAHHKRTGAWPLESSGDIVGAPGETWNGIRIALRKGVRSLPGGCTLAKLLETHRGARNHMTLPDLTTDQVLAWMDDHRTRTRRWPNRSSGAILAAPAESWLAVDAALLTGKRGLPGGDSIARLLAKHRGVRDIRNLPDLSYRQIRAWAELHRKRTGRWPVVKSGPVYDAPGETWAAISQSLTVGRRGLPGGSSLYQLLNEARDRSA
jgi:hypothetical protein